MALFLLVGSGHEYTGWARTILVIQVHIVSHESIVPLPGIGGAVSLNRLPPRLKGLPS